MSTPVAFGCGNNTHATYFHENIMVEGVLDIIWNSKSSILSDRAVYNFFCCCFIELYKSFSAVDAKEAQQAIFFVAFIGFWRFLRSYDHMSLSIANLDK